nr:alpha/beta hydrolase [Roseospira navarrensis]
MTALPRPVLIVLHGGYWQAMDKSVFGFLAPPFVEAGAAVVILNYPLCPDEPLSAITNAVREAIQVLWQDASILGLDRHRFVVAGHSAGGHLVAQMLCTNWPGLDAGMPLDTLKGGIAISGLFDLRPLVRTSINGALRLDTAAAERNSPLFGTPLPGVSLTLAVGELESDAFHDQSGRLLQRWIAQGAHATWIPLPGRHHFTALEALADPRHELFHDALGRLGVPASGRS